MRIITNSNKPNDRMLKVLSVNAINTEIYIASAFFTDYRSLLSYVEKDCEIRLIVRLDAGTSPDALKSVFGNSKIHIRFFTGNSFHPKFYIFGNRVAFLGSSNFTKSGLTTNQEINIEIDSDNPVFDQLLMQFEEYWDSAEVLTETILHEFTEIMKSITIPEPWRVITPKIGPFEFNNVGRDGSEYKKESLYASNFKRSYQRYISKFNVVKEIYQHTNLRRFPDIPIRIEIDRFLWWIREVKAPGDTYLNTPIKETETIKTLITSLAPEFLHYESNYLNNDAVPRYVETVEVFGKESNIQDITLDELYDALLNVHAFHDRFRFFDGGHPTMKEVFLSENNHQKIRDSVNYLLYGKDDYVTRITNCVLDSNFKLQDFGESCVKELYGLINNEDVPICNGRILKSMEWLGFGKL